MRIQIVIGMERWKCVYVVCVWYGKIRRLILLKKQQINKWTTVIRSVHNQICHTMWMRRNEGKGKTDVARRKQTWSREYVEAITENVCVCVQDTQQHHHRRRRRRRQHHQHRRQPYKYCPSATATWTRNRKNKKKKAKCECLHACILRWYF